MDLQSVIIHGDCIQVIIVKKWFLVIKLLYYTLL